MSGKHFITIMMLVVATSSAFAEEIGPVGKRGLMAIEGEVQGRIHGGCEIKGAKGCIFVEEFEHEVYVPEGSSTTSRNETSEHGEIIVVKPVDKASPGLYKALATHEYLRKVVIRWFRKSRTVGEENYFTHELEGAQIMGIETRLINVNNSDYQDYSFMEEVRLKYNKIKWVWEPTKEKFEYVPTQTRVLPRGSMSVIGPSRR